MFLTSEKIIKKNIPIEGSKLIENIGKLKIYEYPTIKLTDFEESSSISLLVVGQTGSGKTTLLNALINALMDIQITDDFRYKIIIEKFDHSIDVNIYNIKPIGNIPAIKIIDTPGFGDSRGIKQDKIIVYDEILRRKSIGSEPFLIMGF